MPDSVVQIDLPGPDAAHQCQVGIAGGVWQVDDDLRATRSAAKSASVPASRKVATATWALNASVWVRRVRRLDFLLSKLLLVSPASAQPDAWSFHLQRGSDFLRATSVAAAKSA